MKPAPDMPAKKSYQQPKLVVYGDLTDMTRTIPAGKGQKDGPTGQKT